MEKAKVCAVVVTYNRKEYLRKLLDNLLIQTFSLAAILIYDNNSKDGTSHMLLDAGLIDNDSFMKLHQKKVRQIDVMYYRSDVNEGGSGGFYGGMKIASSMGFDYLWCMDDDVWPEKNCLEELLCHMSPQTMICQPCRTDQNFMDCAIIDINMRNPFCYTTTMRSTIVYSDEIRTNTIQIKTMPFEGPLIDNNLVKKIGLPKKELFILFDDTDYAMRAQKKTKILYCKNAILHRQIIQTKNNSNLMGWRQYYEYRNQIWFDRTYGENFAVRKIRPILLVLDLFLRALVRRRPSDFRVISKAYSDGVHERFGIRVKPGTPGESFRQGIIHNESVVADEQ